MSALTVFLVGLSASPVVAWNGTGHMVVAQIAVDELSPATKTELEALLGVIEESSAPLASLLLDRLRKDGIDDYDRWHYINLPVAEGDVEAEPPHDDNIVTAIRKLGATLSDRRAARRDRGFAAAALIHLVGDIHQPLHCVSRFSPTQPTGDQGGNRFLLHDDVKLHYLWDVTAGLLVPVDADGDPTVRDHLVGTLANAMRSAHPRNRLPELREEDPARWAEEGRAVAIQAVYVGVQPGEKPDAAYLKRARGISARRIALAGYRLADLIESAIGPH